MIFITPFKFRTAARLHSKVLISEVLINPHINIIFTLFQKRKNKKSQDIKKGKEKEQR